MNFQQLCSQQPLGLLCNNPLFKSFFILNQSQSNGINTQRPATDQGPNFSPVPFKPQSFAPSGSGSLPPQSQGDQGNLSGKNGDDGLYGTIVKTSDTIPKIPSNEGSLLLQAPENPGVAPIEPDVDSNIPIPKPPSPIETPAPSSPVVKPMPTAGSPEVLPIEPEVGSNMPLPKPPFTIEFPYNSPTEEPDTCNKAALSSLINSKYCPQTKEFAKPDGTILKASSIPGKYRVIGPKTIITADYVITRANIHYTPNDSNLADELAEGKVTKITCG